MPALEKVDRHPWYQRNNCAHAHCPLECEHPQPIFDERGELICGRCWIKHGVRSRMLPCVPGAGVCDD